MKRGLKIIIWWLAALVVIATAIFCFYFVGKAPAAENITWGVDFSQMQAQSLGLSWKDAYSAAINDLGVKNIKIHTQWDWIEGSRGSYYFDDIDWMLSQAKSKGVNIIYVLGLKSGRWPECHMPAWAKNLSEEDQKAAILNYTKAVVLRYKDNDQIINWQVENEPLFKFGQCPSWYYDDQEFLKSEVALVKSLDQTRQIIISDSGEQSDWLSAAKIGDIVGITMYRKVWAHVTDRIGFNVNSFLSPVTYWRKALIVNQVYDKSVICIELQAEPWASKPFYDVPLKEQEKTMNLDLFKKNVEYASQTGLKKVYLWGVEWWYWMKEKQNQPQIWNEAKKLFN